MYDYTLIKSLKWISYYYKMLNFNLELEKKLNSIRKERTASFIGLEV